MVVTVPVALETATDGFKIAVSLHDDTHGRQVSLLLPSCRRLRRSHRFSNPHPGDDEGLLDGTRQIEDGQPGHW